MNNVWIERMFKHENTECQSLFLQIKQMFGCRMKYIQAKKTEKDISNVEGKEIEKYLRIYEGESYVICRSLDNNRKLNTNGIRDFMTDIIHSSQQISFGNFSNLFATENLKQFWNSIANENKVAIIIDCNVNELYIIGVSGNVQLFETKLIAILKKFKDSGMYNSTMYNSTDFEGIHTMLKDFITKETEKYN